MTNTTRTTGSDCNSIGVDDGCGRVLLLSLDENCPNCANDEESRAHVCGLSLYEVRVLIV